MPLSSESGLKQRFVLTCYEPRRRWWGGYRADIVLDFRTEYTAGVETTIELARGTWRVPHNFQYSQTELEQPLFYSGERLEVARA